MTKRTNTAVSGNTIRLGKNPSGTDKTTTRFNRNLAILVREMVPAELLVEYHLAILQGHDPLFTRDERCTLGWKVTWPEAEMRPSLADKTASILFLRQAGWGMPAQAHYIEADIRSHAGDAGLDHAALAADPARALQLAQAVRNALQASRTGGKLLSVPGASHELVEVPEADSESSSGVIDVKSE